MAEYNVEKILDKRVQNGKVSFSKLIVFSAVVTENIVI